MDQEEEREILYRLDERTKTIDKKVGQLVDKSERNERHIYQLKEEVNTNSQNISAARTALGAIGTLLVAVAAKVLGVIGF